MHTSSCSSGLKSSKTERRAAPRREIDVLMNQFLNGYPYLCRASDISRTGIRLHPMGESGTSSRFIGLQFQLPGCEDILTASGEVLPGRPQSGPFRVRFTCMPALSADRIARFVATERPA